MPIYTLTNWDEVLPAFDRALEEVNKRIRGSKEATLEFLKEAGLLDETDDVQEKEDKKEE
ncbi:hypothetical protein [Puia dinghuensis]|uniref:Uncharacterized protein n=1 Tax=Puia dinghuensis TaxID=1792502 RepID=A0A8J2XU31_9BACT|nr:hypothetical protein [Puia dinghuensis]GGB08950.1 hypothetical protein GCM10011511_35600 [Puia dinghuensis]